MPHPGMKTHSLALGTEGRVAGGPPPPLTPSAFSPGGDPLWTRHPALLLFCHPTQEGPRLELT